ncbi:hypothetical protein P7D22_00540 [Lichenihabitans sp. Uapishka_5]|uniref:hypothetical protein n=1 Tax=Lichenihabitans sp. Uapishka_5 TaxID=3037302 RepID=UPI0029E7EFA7|nr:hypothetical protein [Lichenihabitans sp. Uapishka_5]MDX7949663.1 hypothetical protein [Lichenihabitans sp. Uapishka_5]
MNDTSAFGIGEERDLDIAAGQETNIRAGSEVSRLKMTFADGAEVELTIGPNEVIRIKRGTGPVRIQFEEAGASVHDPLRSAV